MTELDPESQQVAEKRDVVFLNETPEFGKNYDLGWIGFNHAAGWMSQGIARLTEYRRKSGITISHVFIVTGQDECVEASYGKGVVQSSLKEMYFDRHDRYVVFRKPLGLNDDIAARIVKAAREQLGTEFNNASLMAAGLPENFLTSLVNRLFGGNVNDFLASLVEDDDRWICSELAAYCLNQQPEYHDRSILKHPHSAIDPQRLFEADDLFHPLAESIRDDCQNARVQRG